MSALPLENTNDPLLDLMDKIDNLGVLPHVVVKVLEVLSSDDAPALELEKAIIIDPGLSSKVLALANSTLFGLPRQLTSIREAILFVGYRSVRNLAMTIGTDDLFAGEEDVESERRLSWRRQSVDSAICSKWLALFTGRARPDDCYTAGLLHLIGKTLLDRFGEGDYERVMLMAACGVPELEAEERVFGCNHIQVSAAAGRKWHFPESLVFALDYRTAPEAQDQGAPQRCCAALGSAIAEIAEDRRHNPESEAPQLPQWALDGLCIPSERTDMLVEQGIGAIASSQVHLG